MDTSFDVKGLLDPDVCLWRFRVTSREIPPIDWWVKTRCAYRLPSQKFLCSKWRTFRRQNCLRSALNPWQTNQNVPPNPITSIVSREAIFFLVKHFDLSLNWHRRTPHLLPIFLPNVSRGTLIPSASPSPHFAINAPPPDQYHHSTTYEKQYCSTWNIVEISVTCNVIFHVKHIDRHAELMLFSFFKINRLRNLLIT